MRLDVDALAVETFAIPGAYRGECACCTEPDDLDEDGYCPACGPVEAVECFNADSRRAA